MCFFLNVLAQTPLLSQYAGAMEDARIHHASHSPDAPNNGRELNEEVRKGAALVLILHTNGGELIKHKNPREQLPVLVGVARPEELCHRILSRGRGKTEGRNNKHGRRAVQPQEAQQ